MQLTTRGRYAVVAMLDLAMSDGGKPRRLADIAQRQGISQSYLEQLFSGLRRSELVESARGPGGGYRLARAIGQISIAEIIDAVNEKIDVTRCGGKGDCQRGDTCLTHHLWIELSNELQSFLGGISLQDVIDRNERESQADQRGDTDQIAV